MGIIASLAIMAIGMAVSAYGQIKQGQMQKQAERVKASAMSVRAARERTQQVREARVRKAEILQAGANSGASDSSSVQSGAAGAFAKAYGNIEFINQEESSGKAMSIANQGIINAQGISALGQGIESIGGAMATGAMSRGAPNMPKKPAGSSGYSAGQRASSIEGIDI